MGCCVLWLGWPPVAMDSSLPRSMASSPSSPPAGPPFILPVGKALSHLPRGGREERGGKHREAIGMVI